MTPKKKTKKVKEIPLTTICVPTAMLEQLKARKLRALRVPMIAFYGLTITYEI